MTGRARRAVTDALNGDIDKVEAPTRRGLFALATELDELITREEAHHMEVMETLADHSQRMDKKFAKLYAGVYATASTFVAALIALITNLIAS